VQSLYGIEWKSIVLVELAKGNRMEKSSSNRQGQISLCSKNSVTKPCFLLPCAFCRLISSLPSQVNTVLFLLPDTFHFVKGRQKGYTKGGLLFFAVAKMKSAELRKITFQCFLNKSYASGTVQCGYFKLKYLGKLKNWWKIVYVVLMENYSLTPSFALSIV